MPSKRALIVGVSGPDGAYLARHLINHDYEVHATSRDAENQSFWRLTALGVRDQVKVYSASVLDFRNLLQVIEKAQPIEIYNLAGQSSVGLSFTQPVETLESIALGTMQMLEVLRYLKSDIRFYNAASSECFGKVAHGIACDETAPFRPRSPYAIAKTTALLLTANYREAYGLFACSGILFNHESPLRPARFVTRKIVSTALQIASGQAQKLEIGNLDVWRDWGYAPEYVEAMWRMLQSPSPEDYVIATGESHSLKEFVASVFAYLGLDWQAYVTINRSLFRPTDLPYSQGNPERAGKQLGWSATTKFSQLIPLLVEAEKSNTTKETCH